MEENFDNSLSGLKKKFEFIISKYESLRSENAELTSTLSQCRQNLEFSNNKIKELEQKLDNLQLIDAFKASAPDVKEAKQNIGRLIREVDKCIALLND